LNKQPTFDDFGTSGKDFKNNPKPRESSNKGPMKSS